jgi:hypothetical protein
MSNLNTTLISVFSYKIYSQTFFILGNFNGNNHYDGTDNFCSSINCRQHTAVIAGSIAGGVFGMILLVICILLFYCRCRHRPSQTNLTFVNKKNHKNNKHQLYDITIFKSGIWSSRYLQFGIWHGPNYFSLSFDSQLFKVTGTGSDNIGMFIIDGTYSIRSSRMALTKIYQLGIGNRSENLEHQIIIQLVWNDDTRQFEGKRYVQIKNFREENRFELKFSKQQQQQLSPHERV